MLGMTRCCYTYDEVRDLARKIGLDPDKLPTLTALCQHGKSRDAYCRSCEGGYGDDSAYYVDTARSIAAVERSVPHGMQYAVGAFDDGTFAVYIPARYERRIAALTRI